MPISYLGIEDMTDMASIHNHPIHGFNAPSYGDIENMLKNKNEKYCIVLNENKIWMIQNKYYGNDITKEEDKSSIIDCFDIVKDFKKTFNENQIKNLDNKNSIENINKRTGIELSKILEKHDVSYNIINV